MPGCCTCTPAAWWGGSGMAAQLASANADAGGNVVASVRDPISPCSGPAFVRAQQRSLLCARGAHVSRGVQARLKRGAAPSTSLRCGAGRLLEFIGGTGEGNHRAETEGRSIAVAVPGFAVAVFRSFDVQICGGFCSASGHPLATPGYQSQPRRYDCIRVLFSGPLLAFAPRPPPPPIEVHHPARGRRQSQSQLDVCKLGLRRDVLSMDQRQHPVSMFLFRCCQLQRQTGSRAQVTCPPRFRPLLRVRPRKACQIPRAGDAMRTRARRPRPCAPAGRVNGASRAGDHRSLSIEAPRGVTGPVF